MKGRYCINIFLCLCFLLLKCEKGHCKEENEVVTLSYFFSLEEYVLNFDKMDRLIRFRKFNLKEEDKSKNTILHDVSFVYDVKGRLIKQEEKGRGWESRVSEIKYDDRNRITKIHHTIITLKKCTLEQNSLNCKEKNYVEEIYNYNSIPVEMVVKSKDRTIRKRYMNFSDYFNPCAFNYRYSAIPKECIHHLYSSFFAIRDLNAHSKCLKPGETEGLDAKMQTIEKIPKL